jgi:hypothetical protein
MLYVVAQAGTAKAKKGQLCKVLEFRRELWGSTSEMMEKVLSRLAVILDSLGSNCTVFVESVPWAFPKTGNKIANIRYLRTLQDTCLGIRKAEYRKIVHLSVLM